MKRTLKEKKVLKKLGVSDFRHVTKEKIASFVSMYPEMDADVAKKAIEQFPNFTKNCIQVMDDYKELNRELCKGNEESMKEFNDLCAAIINSLTQYLNNDVTFEQRKWCIEMMVEVAKMVSEKDSENKHFIQDNIGKFVMLGGTLCVVCYSLLGWKATLAIKEQ